MGTTIWSTHDSAVLIAGQWSVIVSLNLCEVNAFNGYCKFYLRSNQSDQVLKTSRLLRVKSDHWSPCYSLFTAAISSPSEHSRARYAIAFVNFHAINGLNIR